MVCSSEEFSTIKDKYEVFYEKSLAVFHREDIKKNIWKAVSEEPGLEDGGFLLNQSNV